MLFLVLFVLFRIELIVAVYTNHVAETAFSDALGICNDTGQDMLTISNWQEYSNSLNYSGQLEVSWLGVEETDTSGEYRWISNKKILTDLRWAPAQPEPKPCAYVYVPDEEWYTESCSQTYNYVCVKNSIEYVVGADKVNYSTAMVRCSDEGGQLPVMITKQDKSDFYTAIGEYNDPSVVKVWLGLVALDEYFQWITGDDLTPPYNWADSGREQRVHYHHAGHKDEGYHSDDKTEKPFVCQPRVSNVLDTVTRSQNNFDRVITNTLLLGNILYSKERSSEIECAAICSLSSSCIRFIQSGSLCHHFDGVSYTNVPFQGFSFWEKKQINETVF